MYMTCSAGVKFGSFSSSRASNERLTKWSFSTSANFIEKKAFYHSIKPSEWPLFPFSVIESSLLTRGDRRLLNSNDYWRTLFHRMMWKHRERFHIAEEDGYSAVFPCKIYFRWNILRRDQRCRKNAIDAVNPRELDETCREPDFLEMESRIIKFELKGKK